MKEEVESRTMINVPLSISFLERRDARGSSASLSELAPPWRHALVSGSHLAPDLSELESVKLELGSCCSDLDKQVSDEIYWTLKRQFEISFRL